LYINYVLTNCSTDHWLQVIMFYVKWLILYPIDAAAVWRINEIYVYVNANGGHYDILHQLYIASTW